MSCFGVVAIFMTERERKKTYGKTFFYFVVVKLTYFVLIVTKALIKNTNT